MDSMPPATTVSTSPARIIWSASAIALRPDRHTLLIVMAGTSWGTPARRGAGRRGGPPGGGGAGGGGVGPGAGRRPRAQAQVGAGGGPRGPPPRRGAGGEAAGGAAPEPAAPPPEFADRRACARHDHRLRVH